jgi:hypothetical protein
VIATVFSRNGTRSCRGDSTDRCRCDWRIALSRRRSSSTSHPVQHGRSRADYQPKRRHRWVRQCNYRASRPRTTPTHSRTCRNNPPDSRHSGMSRPVKYKGSHRLDYRRYSHWPQPMCLPTAIVDCLHCPWLPAPIPLRWADASPPKPSSHETITTG